MTSTMPFATDVASYQRVNATLEAANTACARAALGIMGEKYSYHRRVSFIEEFSGRASPLGYVFLQKDMLMHSHGVGSGPCQSGERHLFLPADWQGKPLPDELLTLVAEVAKEAGESDGNISFSITYV